MSAALATPKKAFRRLPPADRRKQIVDAAIAYFAEFGFEGATRGLAERLGVTQPLIYRYFPSKDDLVRAVYEEVYLSRWRDEWMEAFSRRDVPLRQRLIAFYTSWTDVVFEPEWLRIYMFSGLRGHDINRWWISFIEDHLLRPICEEVRTLAALPAAADLPITDAEIDAYWLFHGGIFYYGVRHGVYAIAARTPLPRFIELSVDNFLHGFPETIRKALA
jgi:AcrR family transcriptional regulator